MIKRLIVLAELQNWTKIYNFIVQYFLELKILKKDILGILIASEEIFSNIIYHAKVEIDSKIAVEVDYIDEKKLMTLKFEYGGVKFNPAEVNIPDVRVSLERRRPGGLGLLIVKRFTDSITYMRCGEKNILEISKKSINF